MEIGILKELGLSEEESKIYITLLKRGSSLASYVAEQTGINRSLVYQILDRLISRGYVSYVIKNNVRYYNPVSPDKLLDLLKEKERKLKEALPELNNLFQPVKEKPIVEILEGTEGIKTILNDILKEKQEWLALGSGKAPELLSYYVEHWEKERVKNKILMKAILDSSEAGKKRGQTLSKLSYTKVKYMERKYLSPSSTWIYSNRLVLVVWSKEHPFAIRTISSEIIISYKNHFEQLWKLAKNTISTS